MNYVNVARNLARGRGLTQDAIGYGGAVAPLDRGERDPIGTHPPLYPIAIAGVSLCGIPAADAALAIPVASLAAVLWLGSSLAARLFGPAAKPLSLLLLIASYPL